MKSLQFRPPARRALIAAAAALLVAVAAACSSNPVDVAPPTIPAAEPAQSPPATQPPAGTVRALTAPVRSAAFDAGSAMLVVLHDEAGLTLLPAGSGPARTVRLPASASALVTDGDGRAYLSTRGGYLVADIPAATVTAVAVDGQPDTDFTAIALRADGRLVLGSADGAVFILGEPTDQSAPVSHREKIFARVDSIVTQGNTAVVLDRGQTSVTSIDADGKPAQALRAGEGATTMVADPVGRVLVTDTRGDELLVFTADPLIMRQRYPVPDAPYGLAGSSGLAWVSQTAANTVVGYDLSTGIPVEKVRYPTVQQPNALGYDADADTLFVVSGSGAGVQIITRASRPQ